MTVDRVLLVVHILFAVVALGTLTMAISVFPRAIRESGTSGTETPAFLAAKVKRYGKVLLVVPTAGLVLAWRQERFGQTWVLLALILMGVALLLLWGVVVPRQARVVKALQNGADEASLPLGGPLAAATVGFNLLWVAILVLMVVKP